jgi:hypothetical protein
MISQTLFQDIGRLEDSNPFLSVILSDDLRRAKPEWVTNLKNNAHLMSTPFDLHATLMSIANKTKSDKKKSIKRGYSLLHEQIPTNRTCEHAGVPIEYCPCFDNVNIVMKSENNAQIIQRMGEFVINNANGVLNVQVICF